VNTNFGLKRNASRICAALVVLTLLPVGFGTPVFAQTDYDEKIELPVTVLVSVVVALAITWLVMILAARSAGDSQPSLMHDVTTRFMGLIVLAMGVQFSLTGLKMFFSS